MMLKKWLAPFIHGNPVDDFGWRSADLNLYMGFHIKKWDIDLTLRGLKILLHIVIGAGQLREIAYGTSEVGCDVGSSLIG